MMTDHAAFFGAAGQPVEQRSIVARFVRATLTMHSIDELFSWITNLMVHQFGVQVAQIWANQFDQEGALFSELRSSAKQNQLFPEPMNNDLEIAVVAKNILQEGRPLAPELVDKCFSPPFARVLHQYRLNYSTGLFLGDPACCLPARMDAVGQWPTPLAITLLLFFSQQPSENDLSDIEDIFPKILPVARSRRLLLAAPEARMLLPFQREATVDFLDLVPHRHEEAADGPPAYSVALERRSVRRFYAAINGRRTVRELCELVRLEKEEATVVVQKLLALSRIDLYTPEGQLLESSQISGIYWQI